MHNIRKSTILSNHPILAAYSVAHLEPNMTYLRVNVEQANFFKKSSCVELEESNDCSGLLLFKLQSNRPVGVE